MTLERSCRTPHSSTNNDDVDDEHDDDVDDEHDDDVHNVMMTTLTFFDYIL